MAEISEDKTRRVQFDFAAEAYRDLSDLQEKLQAPTKAEVVRYAIRTLQWVVSTIEEGKTVIVEDNGAAKEVIFPFIAKPVYEEVAKKKKTVKGATDLKTHDVTA